MTQNSLSIFVNAINLNLDPIFNLNDASSFTIFSIITIEFLGIFIVLVCYWWWSVAFDNSTVHNGDTGVGIFDGNYWAVEGKNTFDEEYQA